jgi:DNA-binding NarL/FixJ family response regulator
LCQAPRYNNVEISFTEVKVLKALATTDTNENIAHKLNMPLGTFHLLKKKLYQKLGIQTKPEAALISRDLNLL